MIIRLTSRSNRIYIRVFFGLRDTLFYSTKKSFLFSKMAATNSTNATRCISTLFWVQQVPTFFNKVQQAHGHGSIFNKKQHIYTIFNKIIYYNLVIYRQL